jgi:hypothetical protein
MYRLSIIESTRQHSRYQRSLLHNVSVPQFKLQKKLKKYQTPYSSLDLIFNHQHLYANLQNSDPELIKYDFNSHSNRWCEFKKKHMEEYLNIKKLTHFYNNYGK